MHIDDIVK